MDAPWNQTIRGAPDRTRYGWIVVLDDRLIWAMKPHLRAREAFGPVTHNKIEDVGSEVGTRDLLLVRP